MTEKQNYYTITGSEIDEELRTKLKASPTSRLKIGHYYVFHTQFDIYTCDVGRTTINPFAICEAVKSDNRPPCSNIKLRFLRTKNSLHPTPTNILCQTSYDYVYDITDAYLKEPEETLRILDNMRTQWKNTPEKPVNNVSTEETTIETPDTTLKTTITVDIVSHKDGTYNAYIATENSSGSHYDAINAATIGDYVADLIDSLEEAYSGKSYLSQNT